MKHYKKDVVSALRWRKRTAVLCALLLVCTVFGLSSAASVSKTGAAQSSPILVTSTAESGTGTLQSAIHQANLQPGGNFTIKIEVTGIFVTSVPEPALNITGNCKIQSLPGATITGFQSSLNPESSLTIENLHIDNSAYPLITTFSVSGPASLLLGGTNSVKGGLDPPNNTVIIYIYDQLVIDEAPGSASPHALTMSNCTFASFGGFLTVEGGNLYIDEVSRGIIGSFHMTGGKVNVTGSSSGLLSDNNNDLFFSGGTLIARGGAYDIANQTPIVISGGSVDARKVLRGAVNASQVPVYLVTVTLRQPPLANTQVTCSVNGGAPFSAQTDGDGKLYLWMPAGTGTASITANGGVYRASGEVKADYNNVMTALPAGVIGVKISPNAATSIAGGKVQFSAKVTGEPDVPQTVTWSVNGGHSGTTISPNGLLRVSARETSPTLRVTATSVYDPSKSDTVKVNVINPVLLFTVVSMLLAAATLAGFAVAVLVRNSRQL